MEKCVRCGLVPKTDVDKAKSLILSLKYEINGEYKGQSKERLMEIGGQIEQGRYEFDVSEVNRVVEYAHSVLAVPPSRLLKDLIKWLFLPAIFLAIMIFILFRIH